MALNFFNFPLSPFSKISTSSFTNSHSYFPLLPNFRFHTSTLARYSGLASHMDNERPRFEDFPYASPPIKDLILDLISTVENRLDSQLLPCTLPHDVQYFKNQSGTAHASFHLRSGAPSSRIDFVLGSWLNFQLPTGGALNITSLSSYMNDTTNAPHLVIEFIQSSPTSLVLILDLPPRKDLILHPDYLKTFYEDSGLEKQRQLLGNVSEIQPYVSPSLFIRSVFSPTAVVVRVNTSSSGEEGLEKILRDEVNSVAKEVLGIWLNLCAFGEEQAIGDDEKGYLKKRDNMFKSKSIEIDIGSALPRMFGQEIADRVMEVLQDII